jgi:hypothetical protein
LAIRGPTRNERKLADKEGGIPQPVPQTKGSFLISSDSPKNDPCRIGGVFQ